MPSVSREKGYVMDKPKIGFVGVGNMGQCAHLKNYAALKDMCAVVAISEPRPELARKVAARYGIPKVYENAEAMLASEKLDGLVASQQFNMHGAVVIPLYKAGIPILTEKPIAASIDVARQMLAALKEGGSWHMVGYHKRSDPATIWAKTEIDRLKASGELGKLRYIRILMPAGDWIAGGFNELIGSDEPYPSLERDPKPSDMDDATYHQYVEFVNYYIHQVNLMRHLLGEPYKVTYADPSGVLLATQSESGVAGAIEMTPYRTTIGWRESALVAFEKGYVNLELPAPLVTTVPGRVELYADPSENTPPVTTSPTLPPVHAMRQQAINFIRAIKGEAAPPCEAQEALEDLLAAREYIRLFKNC
jgi:predicted dehydrogenase